MDKIAENFCNYLKKWADKYHTGTITELSKFLGVSQPQLSNVLAIRRCGSEFWRRSVAEKIGIPYEIMIGIGKDDQDNINEQDCQICSLHDEVIKKHYEIITQFRNKELAAQINKMMVKLEKLEGDLSLEMLKRQIEFTVKEAEKKVIKKNGTTNLEE